jgi:hypothetical protein
METYMKGYKSMYTIYLGGVMSGLSIEECSEWRNQTKERLESLRDNNGNQVYKCLSPCRGKDFLKGKGILARVDKNNDGWGNTILQRDKYDVLRSDIIIFNYLDSNKTGNVSIGTVMEQAWASLNNIFSIVVIDDNNIHQHEFLRRTASLIVPTLEDAVSYLENVLNA